MIKSSALRRQRISRNINRKIMSLFPPGTVVEVVGGGEGGSWQPGLVIKHTRIEDFGRGILYPVMQVELKEGIFEYSYSLVHLDPDISLIRLPQDRKAEI